MVVTASGAGLLLWSWFQHDRTVVLPKPTGQYAVGRSAFDWADETRADTLGPDPKARRELMVWAWYPAARASTAPAAYLPPKWGELRDENAGPLTRLLTQRPDRVRPHAAADAELAPDQPTYPVLIMGPGLGSLATDYTTLAEDLASHGYIVLGVNITYVSSVVVFSDGRVARRTLAARATDAGGVVGQRKRELERLVQLWVSDQRFVLDQLARLNAMNHQNRFAGRLDLQRIGLFGHSFGGATALEVCRVDVRCKAGVNLDGYPFADTGGRDLRQPFMFIWSEPLNVADAGWRQAVRNARRLTSQIPEGAYQLSIRGARHLSFTDNAVLWAPLLKRSGSIGSLDGARGLHITATYVRMFFDRYLRGREAPLLDGPAQAYPEVGDLESRPPSH